MTLLQARTTKVVLSAVLFLSGVLLLVPSAFASNLVKNGSFEMTPPDHLGTNCGGTCRIWLSSAEIPDWHIAAGSDVSTGQIRNGDVFFHVLPEGPTIAYTNRGTIEQTVGTVQKGLDYTLTLDIGHRLGLACCGTADIELRRPGHPPMFVDATGTAPTSGNWSPFTASFVGNSSNAGDSITIQLKSSVTQGNFDSVTLTAVPEPGTLLLFGSGLLLLGVIVRRKRLYSRELSA